MLVVKVIGDREHAVSSLQSSVEGAANIDHRAPRDYHCECHERYGAVRRPYSSQNATAFFPVAKSFSLSGEGGPGNRLAAGFFYSKWSSIFSRMLARFGPNFPPLTRTSPAIMSAT